MRPIIFYGILSILLLMDNNKVWGQSSKATLNHIAIYVSDLKKSSSFYRDIIGLDTIPEPFHDGKHTWFSIGFKSHLHLIEGLTEKTSKNKNTHLCFSVSSVDKFTELLKTNKIEYENWAGEKMQVTARVDGVKQIYFKDPDGYWIEINDAKE
ncbi:MAG TPA: VOC family protein [Chitinophagaceae bacterium]|nr:VOC family protein [Chitinophagaceae bacterium]